MVPGYAVWSPVAISAVDLEWGVCHAVFELDREGRILLEEGGQSVPDVVMGCRTGVVELGAETLPVSHVLHDVGAEGAERGVESSL